MLAMGSHEGGTLAAIQIAQEFGYKIARGSARRAKYYKISLSMQLMENTIDTGFVI
jgi:hypothetical protein